jgi:hypothetical protein
VLQENCFTVVRRYSGASITDCVDVCQARERKLWNLRKIIVQCLLSCCILRICMAPIRLRVVHRSNKDSEGETWEARMLAEGEVRSNLHEVFFHS